MDRYQSTFNTYNKLARDYQERFMDLDLYNDTYDEFCRLIEKLNAHIFEIGCGPGNITRYISGKRPDLSITAIDAAPEMLKLAAENSPKAVFKIMDARDISSLDEMYDGIISGFCMPYLSGEDCKKLIKDSYELLYPGGIFYFSLIEDDYKNSRYETSSNGEHKVFVYYHQEEELAAWLNENNFEIICTDRKKYTTHNGKETTHLVVISRKKE